MRKQCAPGVHVQFIVNDLYLITNVYLHLVKTVSVLLHAYVCVHADELRVYTSEHWLHALHQWGESSLNVWFGVQKA